MLRALAFAIALALSVGQATANEDPWSWFVAKSAIDAWATEVGSTASVHINGKAIVIELTNADGWRHRLQGTIEGTVIRVKLSTNETDLENYPLTGKYTKKVWSEPLQESQGRENIELVGSGIVVGLTRDIKLPSTRTKR